MKKIIILFIFLFQLTSLQAREGSVVCIHGYFRSYKCMIPMGNSLKRDGFEVFLWDYQSRKETIESHAENLVEVLNLIAAKKPGEPIHFTTHSFGGIIVRAAVNHPQCPPEAKMGKAVLLAPPNRGAHLAQHFHKCPAVSWFFGKKSGHQLLNYDEDSMNTIGQFPKTMEVMVIAGDQESRFFRRWVKGPNDGKVTIDETRLSTPHKHKVLHVGHHWIMTSRETIAVTRAFLKHD